MKIFKIIATTIAGLTGSLALIFLASYFGLIPGVRTYIVLSGSMEPAVKIGSLVIVIPQKTYLDNEIISYSPDGSKENVITHRIISKQYPEGIYQPAVYLTSGDANPYFDQRPVKENQVLGKAVFALPYLGIWANFVKQPLGFILFVIVPATIIVWEEFRNIQKEIKKLYQKIKAKQNQEASPLGKEKGGLNKPIIALPIFAAALALTSLSLSVFSDREASTANTFVAGEWVTPTPTPPQVVINEVYYDVALDKGNEGNTSNPDEWVELYNNTAAPINLKNWTLADNSGGQTISNANVYIPANGFALLAKSANTWSYWTIPSSAEKISLGQKIGNGLANDGDHLILRDNLGVTVDQMGWQDDITIWNPACTDVAEGHSLERNPDGYDTDAAADFVDRTTPTPGS